MGITERAIEFLETLTRPVELAWVRAIAGTGSITEVTDALAGYQNTDGGFGQGFEVDIKAPDSQPFAARLAMQVMIDRGIETSDPMVARLAQWLEAEQGEDGCWRFPAGVFAHPLAPWFAHWDFPSLNPALCLAGLARQLGIGSDRLFGRIESLIATMGKPEEAESGAFYEVLPYAEYFAWVDHPARDRHLTAITTGVARRVAAGEYEDAGHFFDQVGGPASAITQRLPVELISAQLDRLAGEQEADGGWPTPYDPEWRAWFSARAISILSAYGRL